MGETSFNECPSIFQGITRLVEKEQSPARNDSWQLRSIVVIRRLHSLTRYSRTTRNDLGRQSLRPKTSQEERCLLFSLDVPNERSTDTLSKLGLNIARKLAQEPVPRAFSNFPKDSIKLWRSRTLARLNLRHNVN